MHLISDFCNRLSQASAAKLEKVTVKRSKSVFGSLFMLNRLGFINSFKAFNEKYASVLMKYVQNGIAVLRGLFSLSKPSLKFYITCKEIQKFVFNNIFGLNGFATLSTSYGKLLLDIECAFFNLGGKLL